MTDVRNWMAGIPRRVFLAAAGLAVLVAIVGVDLCWSYFRSARSVIQQQLTDATSIEFELVRLNQAIEDLTPVLQENRRAAAELDIEIEYMIQDVEALEGQQATAAAEMEELRKGLDQTDVREFRYADRAFSREEVERDLSRRLRSYQVTQTQLLTRREILDKRRQMLAVAKDRISENEQKQLQLAQLSESLNAELRLLEMSVAANDFDFDDPKLKEAQDMARRIEGRIRALQSVNEQEQQVGEVPVELDRRTVTERYDEYFNGLNGG